MKRTVRAAAASLTAGSALVLLPAAVAAPGTIAVGADGESTAEVAALVEQVTGSEPDLSLEAIGAMTVRVPDVGAALEALEDVEGVSFVEKVTRSRSLAFVPNDPLTSYQWYLDAVQAFTFWDLRPALAPVRVAIVDSGIDMGHPEFAGRVVGAKSFVPGEGTRTRSAHGTLVAGEVAEPRLTTARESPASASRPSC